MLGGQGSSVMKCGVSRRSRSDDRARTACCTVEI